MAPKIVEALRTYQTARAVFLDAVHEAVGRAAKDPFSLGKLLEADILRLLCCPLVQDVAQGIQVAGLDALGKLTAASADVAAAVTATGAVSYAVLALQHDSRHVRRAANGAIQVVAASSADGARSALDAGALSPLRLQLEDSDSAVKEAAVRSLNALASAGPEIAAAVLDPPTLQSLVSALTAPPPTGPGAAKAALALGTLQTAVALALGDACHGSPELTARVAGPDGAGAAHPLAALASAEMTSPPPLRAAAFRALAQVASHGDELAEAVVAAGGVPPALRALADASPEVRASASLLLRELGSRTLPLAMAVATKGGTAAIVSHVGLETRLVCPAAALPSVLALGHAATFAASLAGSITDCGGGGALVGLISSPKVTPGVIEATAWAMAALARHGVRTALPLAHAGALPALLAAWNIPSNIPSTPECRTRVRDALVAIARGCGDLGALDPLVSPSSPPEILRHVLPAVAALVPGDPGAQRSFVASGGLGRLQAAMAAGALGGDATAEAAASEINGAFPLEVVAYFARPSPGG